MKPYGPRSDVSPTTRVGPCGLLPASSLARDTVRGALASDRCPQRIVSPRGSLLDPYHDSIVDIIEKYPKLSAVRVLEKLRAQGYGGQISIIRKRLAEIRPRRLREAFIKRETLPGVRRPKWTGGPVATSLSTEQSGRCPFS